MRVSSSRFDQKKTEIPLQNADVFFVNPDDGRSVQEAAKRRHQDILERMPTRKSYHFTFVRLEVYSFASALAERPNSDLLPYVFTKLRQLWVDETRGLSAVDQIVAHPAYQAIIRLGAQALPLVLKALEDRPDHWFPALRVLSGGASPVPSEDRGKVSRMREHWLNWGRENGII